MLEGRGVQGGPFSCGVADAPLPSPVSTRVETLTRAARVEKHAANKQGASRALSK